MVPRDDGDKLKLKGTRIERNGRKVKQCRVKLGGRWGESRYLGQKRTIVVVIK